MVNNRVNIELTVNYLFFLLLQNEKESDAEIERAFNLFDTDKTGVITFDNLKRVALELGETMSDDELKLMVLEANKSTK